MRTSTCHKHGTVEFTDPNLNGDSFCAACIKEYRDHPVIAAAIEEEIGVLKMIDAHKMEKAQITQNRYLRPEEEAAFKHFARKCAEDKELLAEFNRINNASVGVTLTPMQRAVDFATGKTVRDLFKFMEFVVDMWRRLPAEAREECISATHKVPTESSTQGD